MLDMKQCFIIMIIVVCVWCIMFQCRIVFNFILLPKQTAFKILNIVQCCPSSNSIKYWPSWTSDCSDVRVYLLCVSKQVFNKMQKYDNCPHSTSHYIMLEQGNSCLNMIYKIWATIVIIWISFKSIHNHR